MKVNFDSLLSVQSAVLIMLAVSPKLLRFRSEEAIPGALEFVG